MRSHHLILAATLLAAPMAIAGCKTDDPTGPGTGTLNVTTMIGGDPDGYTVQVDDGEERPLGSGSSIQFGELVPGGHRVTLGGVASHCMVEGDNPRTLSIIAGETAQVIFKVVCSSLLGTLEITTAMSGESLDPDGFGFDLDGRPLETPAGSTGASVRWLAPGEHTITLQDIAPNCTPVEGPTRTVNVPLSGSAAVEFRLTCSFIGITIWTRIPLPPSVTAVTRWQGGRSLWGTSASDLFLLAHATEPSRFGVWHYNGSGWTEQVSRIDTVLNGIWGFSSTDVYAVGNMGLVPGAAPAVIVHYDGSVWSDVPGPVAEAVRAQYFGIWGATPQDLFVAGSGVLGHCIGQACSRMAPPEFWRYSDFTNLAGTSAVDVWAIGSRQNCDDCWQATSVILHHDGQAWQESFSQGGDGYAGVWSLESNDVWVVGQTPAQEAVVVHYDGAGWSRAEPLGPGSFGLADVWGSSPSDVYAVGYETVLHYDGSSWTKLSDVGGNRVWGVSREDVFILQPDAILHGSP